MIPITPSTMATADATRPDASRIAVHKPVWAQVALAQVAEWTMNVPLVAKAQVRMLAEGVTDAAPPAASVPDDLRPRRMFTDEQIRSALPEPGEFGWRDLRISGNAR